MQLSLKDIAKAIEDGTRTDNRGQNPTIDPYIAATHVYALLVERGLVKELPFPRTTLGS